MLIFKMFKTSAIKKEFASKGFKIGKATIQEFAKLEQAKIFEDIVKAIRKAKIRGSRVIKKEDFNGA